MGVPSSRFFPLSSTVVDCAVLATGWIVAMAQRAVVFLSSPLMTTSRDSVIQETVDAALRLVDADGTR
jgi:hypothetical protein